MISFVMTLIRLNVSLSIEMSYKTIDKAMNVYCGAYLS